MLFAGDAQFCYDWLLPEGNYSNPFDDSSSMTLSCGPDGARQPHVYCSDYKSMYFNHQYQRCLPRGLQPPRCEQFGKASFRN